MKRKKQQLTHWHYSLKIALLLLAAIIVGILIFGVITDALCWESNFVCEEDAAIESNGHINFRNSVRALFN